MTCRNATDRGRPCTPASAVTPWTGCSPGPCSPGPRRRGRRHRPAGPDRLHRRPRSPARRRHRPKRGRHQRDEPDDHGIGRSRGGLTTKIYLACDGKGRPFAILVTPGQRHDSVCARPLLPRARAGRRRPGRRRPGHFRSCPRCRCTGAGRRPGRCPSSRPRSRRPPVPPGRRAGGPPHSHTHRRGPGPRPTWPAPADAACRPGPSPRPIRRWSSSSCAAGPTAVRAATSGPETGVRTV